MLLWLCVFLMVTSPLAAQVTRPKDVRELAKGGSDAIPQLQPLLKNADLEIRIEAVKTIVDIGTQRSIDPLIEATRDADPEIQIRAADGLVNYYVPGYVKTGLSAKLQRAGKVVKVKFKDSNRCDRDAGKAGSRGHHDGVARQRRASRGDSAWSGGDSGSG